MELLGKEDKEEMSPSGFAMLLRMKTLSSGVRTSEVTTLCTNSSEVMVKKRTRGRN